MIFFLLFLLAIAAVAAGIASILYLQSIDTDAGEYIDPIPRDDGYWLSLFAHAKQSERFPWIAHPDQFRWWQRPPRAWYEGRG